MQRPQKVELTVKPFEKDEKCGYETKVGARVRPHFRFGSEI